MKAIRIGNWKKHGFEFLSIFVAVISAFALNNWNENRRANQSESKILTEIANGLEKDLEDIRGNVGGHNAGLSACNYFTDLIADKAVGTDSLLTHYFGLTRDYISIQNTAGYETLKSKGLELIKNDSLRLQIISLYEYDYNTLRKLEEEYSEMQFNQNYFKEINRILAPHFRFSTSREIIGIDLPLQVSTEQRKIASLYIWKIRRNRLFILKYYTTISKKIQKALENILRVQNGS